VDLKKVYTVNNLDRILQFVRGFERAKKDKNLHKQGIHIMRYKWDDFKGNNGE
jgi:hypothetical protein